MDWDSFALGVFVTLLAITTASVCLASWLMHKADEDEANEMAIVVHTCPHCQRQWICSRYEAELGPYDEPDR